jgi:hypothetical protein
MHPHLESVFDDAEHRYLKSEELLLLSRYVESLPQRLEVYRAVRDQELAVMQSVADKLEAACPGQSVETLERSIKHSLLLLRYCSMGMLLNDEAFVKQRLLDWLIPTCWVHDTLQADSVVFRLMNQQLAQALNAEQLTLLNAQLLKAQNALMQQPASSGAALSQAVG